ncbi:hypothetical protein ACIPW5_06310 [Streptomyces sp. NPDC090077]|uniref:hypothetical protein n=1 Tax=Streptomyces sp. NPDC090077 TaxID=3365938 RepID=UPI00382A473D
MNFNRKHATWTGALVAALSVGALVSPAAQAAGGKTDTPTAVKLAVKKPQGGVPAKSAAKNQQRATALAAAAVVSLHPGDVLASDEYIETENGFLHMQPDGNLVLNHKAGAELWASGTFGNTGAYAVFQTDGNFVVYKKGGGPAKGGALWNSATWGNANGRLDFQDDANLVVYRADNSAAWSTRTWKVGNNTLTGGQNLERGTWMSAANSVLAQDNRGYFAVFYRGKDYGLGFWNYSPGAYTRMQTDGNLVTYKKDGGEGKGGALWNTKTWGQNGAYLAFGATDSTLVLHKSNGDVLIDFKTGDNQQ